MEKDDLFSLVMEQFPDGIIILNSDYNIIFVNSMAEKIRYISRDEKIGQNVLNCHPQKSHEKVRRALKYLNEKESNFHRIVKNHEENKIYKNIYKAIRNDRNETVGAIVISKDITEKYNLEQEKLQNSRMLQEQVTELNSKLNNLFLSSLESIVNTLEAKDIYTKGHSIRVTGICKDFIEQAIGQTQLLLDIDIAGKLHDVGKIGVRESILNKTDKLTDEEYEHMKTHTTIAEQILRPIDKLKGIIDIIRHHHERFDGKGYPDGLKGEEIHTGSRILALADTYDAMTSSRPYRNALKPEDAILDIRRNLGSQFDPVLGEKFITMVESGTIG